MRRGFAAILCLMFAAAPALAHSELRRSSPANGAALNAAPEAIELTFNEKVQVTAIRLYRDGGTEIALERPAITERATERRLLPALSAGAYRIEWRAISADGHPVGGAIRFRIGTP
ncbi:MAG: copper resistance CopC family protein [Bosea sp. (in: a-proteobacteria)]